MLFRSFDSAEACRGGKAEGYDFWVEVGGKRLSQPEAYANPAWPIGFDRVVSHWKVDCLSQGRKAGEMVVENRFDPDEIAVSNQFLPSNGVKVKGLVQGMPFTRDYSRVCWKQRGERREKARVIDWQVAFKPGVDAVELGEVEVFALEGEGTPRMVIRPEKGRLVVNDGERGDRWPDGWNYLELREESGGQTDGVVVQSFRLRIESQ